MAESLWRDGRVQKSPLPVSSPAYSHASSPWVTTRFPEPTHIPGHWAGQGQPTTPPARTAVGQAEHTSAGAWPGRHLLLQGSSQALGMSSSELLVPERRRD